MLIFIESGCKLHETIRRLYHICPIDLLEFEPLCKEDSVRSSMLQGIRAKRDGAATFIGHQRRDLKTVI